MLTQGKSRRTQHAWSSAGQGPSGEPNGACNPTRPSANLRALRYLSPASRRPPELCPAPIGRASGTCLCLLEAADASSRAPGPNTTRPALGRRYYRGRCARRSLGHVLERRGSARQPEVRHCGGGRAASCCPAGPNRSVSRSPRARRRTRRRPARRCRAGRGPPRRPARRRSCRRRGTAVRDRGSLRSLAFASVSVA